MWLSELKVNYETSHTVKKKTLLAMYTVTIIIDLIGKQLVSTFLGTNYL